MGKLLAISAGLLCCRLMHIFHYCLQFGCCVVLILALSFSLGAQTVF